MCNFRFVGEDKPQYMFVLFKVTLFPEIILAQETSTSSKFCTGSTYHLYSLLMKACIGMALSCAKWKCEALCLKSSLRTGTAERRTKCEALLSTGPWVTVCVSSLGSRHCLYKLSVAFHSFHWVKHQRCSHKGNTNFLINSHKKWNRKKGPEFFHSFQTF